MLLEVARTNSDKYANGRKRNVVHLFSEPQGTNRILSINEPLDIFYWSFVTRLQLGMATLHRRRKW